MFKKIIAVVIVCVFSIVPFTYAEVQPTQLELSVDRVIDGDTIKFENNFICRLYGIDTPEVHRGQKLKKDVKRTGISEHNHLLAGDLSANYTKEYFSKKRKYIIYDFGEDLYKRHLCAIEDFNEKILRDGYAVLYRHGKSVHNKELREKLRKAQEEGLNEGLNAAFGNLMDKLREF